MELSNKKTLGINNIYYINLKRSPERKEHMLKEFESFKEIPIRINAIDALEHKTSSYVDYDMEVDITTQACALSHIYTIITAFKDGCSEALILPRECLNKFSIILTHTEKLVTCLRYSR